MNISIVSTSDAIHTITHLDGISVLAVKHLSILIIGASTRHRDNLPTRS